jgi:hypothetical protein
MAKANMGFVAATWLQPPRKLEEADREAFKALVGQVRSWLKDPPKSWQRIDHLTYLEFPRPWYAYAHLRWTPAGQKTVTSGIGALHDLGLWGILERARQMREKLRCDGIDPRDERRKRRQPAVTLVSIWPSYRAAHIEGSSPKHVAQYDLFWTRYIKPALGDLDRAGMAANSIPRAPGTRFDRESDRSCHRARAAVR